MKMVEFFSILKKYDLTSEGPVRSLEKVTFQGKLDTSLGIPKQFKFAYDLAIQQCPLCHLLFKEEGVFLPNSLAKIAGKKLGLSSENSDTIMYWSDHKPEEIRRKLK